MPFKDFQDEHFLSSLLDTMTDGVMVVDPEGIIMCLNPAAERITGYASSEIIGKPCTLLDTDACLVSEGDTKVKRCSLFKEGKVSNRRCQIRGKNGQNVMLLKNAVTLRDPSGQVVGAVETMTDVTSLFMKEMEVEQLRRELSHEYGFMGLVGNSPAMQQVYEQIRNASQSDVPVIISGESGTGKELAAEAIHRMSRRKEGPYIRVNCAALNEHLLETELFGHRKGAFTGAVADRKGRFEVADGGSLFLDEIGDMSPAMQVKLLRVLQEKEVERIGENHPVKVDVRIITATNRDLDALMESGKFREDLYYRVHVLPVHIPPLREHIEDLAQLVPYILKRISVVNRKAVTRVTPEAYAVLESFEWPGNIRQLNNALEYAAITCRKETIEARDLPEYLSRRKPPMSRRGRQMPRAEELIQVLRDNGFNRTRAAEALGISRVALWKRMKRLGISDLS